MNTSTPFLTVVNDTLDDSPPQQWSPLFIAFGLFGIIDNGLVLVIMGSDKSLRNATNLLIANQSLIDLMTSLLLLILTMEPGVLSQDRPVLARFVCIFWMSWYPFWATITASSVNLLMITFERFCAIVYPIQYRQRMTTKRVALLAAIPWIYGSCVNCYVLILTQVDGGKCDIIRFPNKDMQLGVSFLLSSLHFVGIILTIAVLYIIIAVHLRHGPDGKTGVVNFKERARRNVLRTMLIVFACYVICWAPNDIYTLNHIVNHSGELQGTVYGITVLIAFSNAWINPVIYSFRYERFQKASLRLFCSRDTGEQPAISV